MADGRRQAGNGRARNRARARLNWVSQGQRWGRCKVRRRAERVSRPAIEKKRRRRVLVVTTCSPRPSRAVQRARLCAITWTASQAALAAKRPEGRWLSATPYFRSRMAFSISAWRRWSASSSRVCPVPIGDEAVIAVADEEDQLGTRRGLHPPDDEPYRRGVGPHSGRGCRWSRPRRRRRPSSSNCLECQEEQSTTGGLMSRHGQPCLSMELRMTSSLRIQATKATFFALPAASSF